MPYTGLPPALKRAVFSRDGYRCRWCGTTNRGPFDAHHIEYRRGYSYDRLDNLITLCRLDHDLVHDSYKIPKPEAQKVLLFLIGPDGANSTGLAVVRRDKRSELENGRSSDIEAAVKIGQTRRLLAPNDAGYEALQPAIQSAVRALRESGVSTDPEAGAPACLGGRTRRLIVDCPDTDSRPYLGRSSE